MSTASARITELADGMRAAALATQENTVKVIATIPAGNVEYSKEKAEIEIDELIAQLEQAKEDGATHVVGLSGNYRGAGYVRLGRVSIDDEDGDDY